MSAKPGPAFTYHQAVSYDRDRMGSFQLDWAARPSVQKTYPGQLRLELDREFDFPPLSLPRILNREAGSGENPGLSPKRLSRILFAAYGATASSRQPDGEFFFRTAPSAGALYPAELYLVLAQAEARESGLEPGLYHYPSPDHGLTLLRPGSFGLPGTVFFLTAVTFRSAWKYRARAFRYCGLDTGHLTENLILALKAEGYDPETATALEAGRINSFLGLDPEREGCLLAVGLKGVEGLAGLPPADDPGLARSSLISNGEKRYKELERIKAALGERVPPVPGEPGAGLGLNPGPWKALPEPPDPSAQAGLGRCLILRRSKRNFIRTATAASHLGGLARLMRLESGIPLQVGLLLGGVEGIEDGFHLLDRAAQSLALVKPGDRRAEMARACLDQAWVGQAGIHFLFLADLARVDRSGGAGAYLETLLMAGRLGQRIYLGAAGVGLGCCGVGAFYDQECQELLGLGPNSRLLYLVAAGSVKK